MWSQNTGFPVLRFSEWMIIFPTVEDRWFSPVGIHLSLVNTYCHDITELLLKVAIKYPI